MSLLVARGLTRRPWFENLELTLGEGEITFLRGPSGAGKSLLLRALADLDPTEEGSVALAGRERGEYTPQEWRRAVLYVHQSGVRLPGSVAENVAAITHLEAVRGAASPVPGLDPDADAGRLSGGEAQLLALHRALLVEPRVLLLDETTGALDPDAAREAEGRVNAHAAAGNAVLWATHDDALVARHGGREVRPW